MYYGFIRIIVTIVFFSLFVLLLKRFKNKAHTMLGSFVIFTLTLTLWYYPVENLFVNFKTPQSLFNYAGQGEIIEVVENQDSTALITRKETNNYSTFFIIKRTENYKIATFDAIVKLSSKQYNSINITLYNIKGTDDYYLRIWGISEEEVTIRDTCNTEFTIYYDSTANSKKLINALAVVPYSSDYSCFIDGHQISFD